MSSPDPRFALARWYSTWSSSGLNARCISTISFTSSDSVSALILPRMFRMRVPTRGLYSSMPPPFLTMSSMASEWKFTGVLNPTCSSRLPAESYRVRVGSLNSMPFHVTESLLPASSKIEII